LEKTNTVIENFPLYAALLGGMLIGISAALLLLLNGKIAGISGILGGLLTSAGAERYWRQMFIIGLLAGGFLTPLITGKPLDTFIAAPWWLTIVAGLLVGIGTRLGSGCTSGHGVCGLARLSQRSLVATLTFIGTAILTVFVMRHVLAGI
jgi:uncharacterized membrane protein YedE/YeeE